jgi:hypothetical protein
VEQSPQPQEPPKKMGWGKVQKSTTTVANDTMTTVEQDNMLASEPDDMLDGVNVNDPLALGKLIMKQRSLPVEFPCGTSVIRHSKEYILQPGVWVQHQSSMIGQVVSWEEACAKNSMCKRDYDCIPVNFDQDPMAPIGAYAVQTPRSIKIITEEYAREKLAIRQEKLKDLASVENIFDVDLELAMAW